MARKIELSDDQNLLSVDGEFYKARSLKNPKCYHCDLFIDICNAGNIQRMKCGSDTRKDKKNIVWVKHVYVKELPKVENVKFGEWA